jgi:hypothetical protein
LRGQARIAEVGVIEGRMSQTGTHD